ncbi:DUF3459 domain-containing protein [Neorhizobium galegae]|nr:DUF3459 domain-containing protein [Neorhizobium galegae]
MLGSAGGRSGKVLRTDKGFLAVSWNFPKGTLSMAINIGEKAQALPDLPGKVIFAWPEQAKDLPPNSVLVRAGTAGDAA